MKRTAVTLSLVLLGASAWASPSPPTDGETSPQVQRWADRCTDFTTNGWAFKSPANFLPWLDVFSDPGIWLEFARRGMEPQSYIRTANSLLEPAMVRNYLEWTDPAIYEKWAGALATPDFITNVNAILFDPGKLMRWAMLPLEPKAWALLATAVSPQTLLKWLNAPLAPEAQTLLARAADPRTGQQLLEALQDPANYPGMVYLGPASAASGDLQRRAR